MTILVLNGPNLGRLGSASRRSTATRPTPTSCELIEAAARRAGLEVEVRQTDDEAELLGWLHEAADAGDPGGAQPGGCSPTSFALRDALRRADRAAGRGAHLQHPRPRGVPAPRPRLRRRRRRDRRASGVESATCWRCGAWPAGARDEPREAGRRGPAAGRRGGGRAGRRAGHQPGQRPLPDRVHRLQRRAAGAHRRRRPVRHRRPLHHPGRQRGARRSSCSIDRGHRAGAGRAGGRGGVRRLGFEAHDVTVDGHGALQQAWPTAASARRAGQLRRRGRGAARGQGRRRDRRAAPGLRGRRPGAGRAARRGRLRPGRTEREVGRELDARMLDAGRRRPVLRHHRGDRPELARSRTTGPTDRAAARGDFAQDRLRGDRRRLPRRHDPHLRARARRPTGSARSTSWSRAAQAAGGHALRGRAPTSRARRRGRPRRDRATPGTASTSPRPRARRRPGDPRGAEHRSARTRVHWLPACPSPSSRGSTCRAAAVSASRTPWSSRPTGPSCSPSRPRELLRPLTVAQETTRGHHQRPEERPRAQPRRPALDRRRVPARQAGQGPRLRAHHAEERAVRQGRRQDLQRRHQGRDGERRQARHDSTCTRTATTSSSWTATPTTRSTCPAATVGDGANYLLENTEAMVAMHDGIPLYVELPASVELSSRTPTRACRATAPPAAPSRPRWRPAPRSRCRCSSPPARRSRSTPATAGTSAASTDGLHVAARSKARKRALDILFEADLRGVDPARRAAPSAIDRRPTRRCPTTPAAGRGVGRARAPGSTSCSTSTPRAGRWTGCPPWTGVLRIARVRAALGRRRARRGGHRRGGRAGQGAVHRRVARGSSTACWARSWPPGVYTKDPPCPPGGSHGLAPLQGGRSSRFHCRSPGRPK